MTREFIDFVNAHKDEDTARLLLSAARYPGIDIPLAVQQIEGLHTARDKWPSLTQCDGFLYPPRLNREQASSETTAAYKVRVADSLCDGDTPLAVADLTGGMGVDSIAFARRTGTSDTLHRQALTQVDYVERSAELCALMEHNGKTLGLTNISVHHADSMEWLASSERHYDIIYIDPARRAASGRKMAAFEDCEPNILEHMELLRSRCRWLMVKASPMIDIDQACRRLGTVAEVHVVAGGGECKEVLFLCGEAGSETVIHCGAHSFTRREETSAMGCYCTAAGRYLYEPDAALMKAAPYRSICHWYNVEALDPNTHLYTSDRIVSDFPGRRFEVLGEVKLSRKAVSAAIPGGRAHVVVRNYPAEADALQRQLGLKEGGELFVVATTVGKRPHGFLCARF